MRTSIKFTSVCLLVALSLSSCRGESIETYRVPKESDDGGHQLRWSAPEGWTELEYTGSLWTQLYQWHNGGTPIKVSITPLRGEAGGVLANVNRWRTQLQLAPVDEESVAALSEWQDTPAGRARLIDVAGLPSDNNAPEKAFAAILPHEGVSWFVKMTGPQEAMDDAAWTAFGQFVTSFEPKG